MLLKMIHRFRYLLPLVGEVVHKAEASEPGELVLVAAVAHNPDADPDMPDMLN